ncbi:MAG: pyridoxamine 5'-phosphate oxidase family protein [Prevotella sp.]|jgi:nitroimidazol reductase NimA-like FMN-containing flavoprotein (pyridoxamine 5'-phosphate oxidase superfamily)
MKYVNETVRRQDRLMNASRAIELLRESEYGVLSMVDTDGTAYGVPLNYVWDGDHSIYIHCAPEGHKLKALEAHPDVSFCIVGKVNLLPGKFTTEYESVLLRGTAHLHLSKEEMMKALHLLVDKLSPDFKERGYFYCEKSFHRVNIIRVDFTEYSGKCKHVPTANKLETR